MRGGTVRGLSWVCVARACVLSWVEILTMLYVVLVRVRKVRRRSPIYSAVCVPEPHGEGTWVLDVVPMMQQLGCVECVSGL